MTLTFEGYVWTWHPVVTETHTKSCFQIDTCLSLWGCFNFYFRML